jgi:hypothetical protein
MTANATSYNELLAEYRFALGIWTETKVLYPPDGPELAQAVLRLDEIEARLRKAMPIAA